MAIAPKSKPTNTSPLISKTKTLEIKRRILRNRVVNPKEGVKTVTFDLSLNLVVSYDPTPYSRTKSARTCKGKPQVVLQGKTVVHEGDKMVKGSKVSKEIKSVTCSKCRNVGHNVRTCIWKPQVVSKGKAIAGGSRKKKKAT